MSNWKEAITMFDNQALANQIQNTLNLGVVNIPEGKKVAFVIHGDLDNHMQVKATAAFVVKVNDEWQVQSLVDWSHDEGVKAGVTVAWSK